MRVAGAAVRPNTPWCAPCRTVSSRSNGCGPLCPSSDGGALRSSGSPPRRTPKDGSGCAPASGWCCPSRQAAHETRGTAARHRMSPSNSTPTSSPRRGASCWSTRVAGLMVLTGRRSGMFRRDDVAALARRYLAECLAVARAEGANLGDDVVDEIVGMFAKAPEDMTTSMLTDREARRPLEWDIRNGVISRKARPPRTGHSDQRRPGCRCWPRRATAPARQHASSVYGHEAMRAGRPGVHRHRTVSVRQHRRPAYLPRTGVGGARRRRVVATLGDGDHQGDVDQPATARRRHHQGRQHARRHHR